MAAATLPSQPATAWPSFALERLAISRVKTITTLVVAISVLALYVRLVGLSTYGLSEDEVSKVLAIDEYRLGHLTANAEHPMLMKLAMWGSVALADAWNRTVPSSQSIAIETAVRLPNAVAGAVTTAALFGLCQVLFGSGIAIMASLLWALDVNAIAINRIGKEDTFLLLFFVLGIWCYEFAKHQGASDSMRAQRWYRRSGASFGLMLASKYMPHYLGIYAIFNAITDRNPGANRPDKLRYYGVMAAVFVAANVAILMPATWRYCLQYLHGDTLTHHGYLFAGQLYVTDIPVSPLGVPPTFYLRLLATKVPVVVLAGAVAGGIEAVRRRHERGFTLIRVWLLFSLLPYSLMAAKFIRYALPMFAAIDVLAAVGVVSGMAWLLRKSWLTPATRVAAAAAILFLTIAGPTLAQRTTGPFYSLFRNVIGEGFAASGRTFSEETYDYGVREAVAAIAANAEPSAVIVSDAPAVVAHYLRSSGRTDLRVRSLSARGIPIPGQPSWVIVQDEHTTFENQGVVAQLRTQATPWRELYAGPVLAAQVFHIRGR